MHFNSSSYTSSKALAWDPDTVLGLTNRTAYGITCIGYAPSQGRRCRNRVAHHKVECAISILKKAGTAPKTSELRPAAELLLCYLHGRQSPDIISQWRFQLEDWVSDHSDECSSISCNKSVTAPRSVKSEPRVKKENLDDFDNYSAEELRKMMREMLEAERRRTSGKTMKQEDETERDIPRNTFKRESNSESPEQKRRQERERQEKQREEEERRQKEEKKREEERRQKEDKKREERRREEEKREEKAREEAFRERVRLAQEKRKRTAREKAQKEAAEWQAAWKRYCDGWTKGADLSVANIAWPVKSGFRRDVDEASVKLFFEKAPPEELVNSGEKMFKLINAENMRWHTDKVMQRFGSDVVNGAAKAALAIIAKVMIELRQEAQKNR